MTTEEPSPAPTVERRWVVAVAAAVVAVIAIALAAVAWTGDTDTGTSFANGRSNATAQAQVGQACRQWMGTPNASGVTGAWCGHMDDWMYQQMQSGRRGSMMWGSSNAMYDTCVAAMGTYQQAVDDPAAWCRSMVDWMTHNGVGYGGMMGR